MSNGIYTYYDVEKCKVVYVGRDSNINKSARHKAHMSKSKYNAQPFNRALQNNPDRYHYSVLKEGNYDNDTLNAMEMYYIDIFNTYHYDYPDGFNFDKGGDGSTGRIVSEETRAKQREAKKGMYIGENNPMYGKRGKEASFYGKTHTEEVITKFSEKTRYKLPVIRRYNSKNTWRFTAKYKDDNKYKTKDMQRKSLTDCILKLDEFLNSEQNNLGLIIPIIEIDIGEDL